MLSLRQQGGNTTTWYIGGDTRIELITYDKLGGCCERFSN